MNRPASTTKDRPRLTGAPSSRTAVALARELRAETRREIERADAKASTLLAGGLVVVGFTLNTVHGSLGELTISHALWWLAMLAILVGLAFLCACIYPRGTSERRARLSRHVVGYFGHVLANGTAGELEHALRQRAAMPALDRLCVILHAEARIAQRKYLLTRVALWAFGAGASSALASVVLGRWM
jgi:hypothetical protein